MIRWYLLTLEEKQTISDLASQESWSAAAAILINKKAVPGRTKACCGLKQIIEWILSAKESGLLPGATNTG